MNQCLQCGADTKNPKFCNSSCSAKFTNKIPKRKKLPRLCKKCGESDESKFYKSNASVCRKCDMQVPRQSTPILKRLCVEYKGGKCERCGYNKCMAALDFHHLDPTTKLFNIAGKTGCLRGQTLTESLILELDKCILVCANCHREIHHQRGGVESNDEPLIAAI